jgi:putative membrane protein
MMVADHKKDVRKFDREAKKAGPLGDYASETLPTLKKHLQEAEKLPSGSSAAR